MAATASPQNIADALARRVIGQAEAVREMAIALAKKLQGLNVGNVLLIGSSGTGKTTLMRAVESFLEGHPELAPQWPLIRVHASVLAEETASRRPGAALLERLLGRARERFAGDEAVERTLERARHGVVFVDEIDKIRATVGGQPNPTGIRAQEALLTLIENEAVPFRLPEWAGGGEITVDASDLLFVCAGAFEGLYDAVYDRVTIGRDRGSLQAVSVLGEGSVHHEVRFGLREWMRWEDLFDYGLTPQFLSRFESIVLLHDLAEDDLVRIFLETPDSGLAQAREYFAAQGVQLAISPAAIRRLAAEAARQPRLGARAMREVFRRVVRDYEFDPAAAATDGALLLDRAEIDAALAT